MAHATRPLPDRGKTTPSLSSWAAYPRLRELSSCMATKHGYLSLIPEDLFDSEACHTRAHMIVSKSSQRIYLDTVRETWRMGQADKTKMKGGRQVWVLRVPVFICYIGSQNAAVGRAGLTYHIEYCAAQYNLHCHCTSR